MTRITLPSGNAAARIYMDERERESESLSRSLGKMGFKLNYFIRTTVRSARFVRDRHKVRGAHEPDDDDKCVVRVKQLGS